jgi:hypothetical protein
MNIWGNVPAYFGGIALVLTIVVILRDRNERIKHQADRLAAWVERSKKEGEAHKVLIKNASDLPCMDVGYWITEGYTQSSKLRLSKSFGADTDRRRKAAYIHAVGPGETVIAYETTEDVAVRQITFTDAAGRHWTRVGARLMQHKPSRWPKMRPLTWRLRCSRSHGKRDSGRAAPSVAKV